MYYFVFCLYSFLSIFDYFKNYCISEEFVLEQKGKNFIFYIKMDYFMDWIIWSVLVKCLKIWDLDVRGFYKSMWWLWIKGNYVLIVGCFVLLYCYYKLLNVIYFYIKKGK